MIVFKPAFLYFPSAGWLYISTVPIMLLFWTENSKLPFLCPPYKIPAAGVVKSKDIPEF